MDKEIVTFGYIKINKNESHHNKNPSSINDVDI